MNDYNSKCFKKRNNCKVLWNYVKIVDKERSKTLMVCVITFTSEGPVVPVNKNAG